MTRQFITATVGALVLLCPFGVATAHADDLNGYPHEGNAHGSVACVASGFCAGFTRSDFTSGDVYVAPAGGVGWRSVPGVKWTSCTGCASETNPGPRSPPFWTTWETFPNCASR